VKKKEAFLFVKFNKTKKKMFKLNYSISSLIILSLLTFLIRSTLAFSIQTDEFRNATDQKYKEATLVQMLNYLKWYKDELESGPDEITQQEKQVFFRVLNMIVKERRKMAGQQLRQNSWYASRGRFF
jgi:hypothetical protein